MTENAFLLLLAASFITFFAAFLKEGTQSITLSVFSAVMFIIAAAASVSVDVAAGSELVPYEGNAALGLLSLGFAVASGALAIARLEDVI